MGGFKNKTNHSPTAIFPFPISQQCHTTPLFFSSHPTLPPATFFSSYHHAVSPSPAGILPRLNPLFSAPSYRSQPKHHHCNPFLSTSRRFVPAISPLYHNRHSSFSTHHYLLPSTHTIFHRIYQRISGHHPSLPLHSFFTCLLLRTTPIPSLPPLSPILPPSCFNFIFSLSHSQLPLLYRNSSINTTPARPPQFLRPAAISFFTVPPLQFEQHHHLLPCPPSNRRHHSSHLQHLLHPHPSSSHPTPIPPQLSTPAAALLHMSSSVRPPFFRLPPLTPPPSTSNPAAVTSLISVQITAALPPPFDFFPPLLHPSSSVPLFHRRSPPFTSFSLPTPIP